MALVLGGALVLCAPLLWHGPLPDGSDVVATTHFLQGFLKAWSEGDLYPRWTDRTNRDLGAPSFVLLVPLTYYGAALATWIAGSMIGGLKLYLVAVSLLAGLSFYLLAREWIGSPLPAAAASVLYMLLPYHVLDMYQRFALSETTAFVYLPLILMFARRVVRGAGGRHMALLALSYAGLVATHLVSGYLVSLFTGLWLIRESGGRWHALRRPVLALSCGLLVTAPALLPALVDKQAANVAWLREMPNGDVRTNFLFRDEVLPGFGTPDPVKRPVLLSAHSQLALSGLALALAMACASWRRDPLRRDAITLASVSGVAYILQTPLSQPVWLVVPELATVQFPWRLQTLMVLAAALLGGIAVKALRHGDLPGAWRRWGTAALIAVVAANLALSVWTASLRSFLWEESVVSHPAVTTWVEPAFTPVGFEQYRHLPRMPLDLGLQRAKVTAGDAQIRSVEWRSSSRRIELEARTAARIQLGSFWFPGWEAEIDGRPIPLETVPPLSTMSFEVPPGRHVVQLRFGPTPARRWGWVLMGVGMAGVTAVWLRPGRRAPWT